MKKLFVISVVALCTLALAGYAVGQNLLLNPGFETWTAGPGGPPDSWIVSTTALTATQEGVIVNNGSYSCNLTWTSTSNQDFIQEVPVTGGQTYHFDFWAYDNDPYGRVRVCILWYGPSHAAYVGYYGEYSSDDANWQLVSSGDQTAPDTAVTARCQIRCYDVSGFPGTATVYVDDAVFEEAVAPEPDTVSIYDIQYTTDIGGDCYDSPYDGQVVWTQGIVTAVNPGTFPDFYLQDGAAPWCGVFVYDATIVPTVGDEILLKVDVDEYYGMTELKNVADYTILSTGNTPPLPLEITTADLAGGCSLNAEQYEGCLVIVRDVRCTDDLNTYNEWYVTDSDIDHKCQIDDNMYFYDPYPGQPFTFIAGCVDYSFYEYQINPRAACDICEAVAVELASFEAAAGDGHVTLTWQTAAEIETHSFNIYRNDEVIATVPAFGDAHDYIYVDRQVINGETYTYQLSDVDLNGVETVHPVLCSVTPTAVPTTYALSQNYPNPFNPNTQISYAIPAEAHVTLKIYNLLGQEIATLVDGVKQAGQHTVSWNAADQASGVYFYTLQTDDFSATKKMVYMK